MPMSKQIQPGMGRPHHRNIAMTNTGVVPRIIRRELEPIRVGSPSTNINRISVWNKMDVALKTATAFL